MPCSSVARNLRLHCFRAEQGVEFHLTRSADAANRARPNRESIRYGSTRQKTLRRIPENARIKNLAPVVGRWLSRLMRSRRCGLYGSVLACLRLPCAGDLQRVDVSRFACRYSAQGQSDGRRRRTVLNLAPGLRHGSRPCGRAGALIGGPLTKATRPASRQSDAFRTALEAELARAGGLLSPTILGRKAICYALPPEQPHPSESSDDCLASIA
jgi:hypothetical protein